LDLTLSGSILCKLKREMSLFKSKNGIGACGIIFHKIGIHKNSCSARIPQLVAWCFRCMVYPGDAYHEGSSGLTFENDKEGERE
jgi:hypothetical protein